MERIRAFGNETFASLHIRNYRLYFFGQGISLAGTWIQTVALGWLMLELTGSGVQLGGVLAAQYLPVLLGSIFAGAIVDSFDKRRILYGTQIIFAILAFSVSVLVFTDTIQVWMLYAFALFTGIGNAIDNPARQTFVHELVGREHLRNAVTLISTIANLARAIGPLIGGALIAVFGIAACLFVNALTFVVVMVMLYLMREREFHKEEGEHAERGPLFSVVRYVASNSEIRRILFVMAAIGTLSYEFPVSLPLLAQRTFLGDAASYALLFSAMGVGSVLAGLVIARRKNVTSREFALSVIFFGLSICATALMPTLALAMLGMFVVGYFSMSLSSVGNTILQLEAAPHMRGRVMSLWSMALFGSTLIGAPIIGLIGERAGPRWAIFVGGVAALAVGALAYTGIPGKGRIFSLLAFMRIRREPDAEYPKI